MEVKTMKDTIRLLFHLRNSPDLKLRAIVRKLIRSDIRMAKLEAPWNFSRS
jgi:hypothetical protein